MRRLALLLLAAAPIAHVTPQGRIGPLQLDRSTRAQVIAFAGKPQVEAHMYGYFEKQDPLDALGYRCAKGATGNAFRLAKGTPPCRDVFWVDARTKKLGNAFLTDRRYVGPHGIRVGTSSVAVESALHKRLVAGCTDAIHDGALTLLFEGGRLANGNHVVGAHVVALVLDGHQRTGLFECL